MLVDQFDELMEARPFHPFRVFTADGRNIVVKSPEFAWHAPANRMIWVASGKGDQRVHLIDLHLVTKFVISTSNGHAKPTKRRRSDK
jgi:hypothetical protein